MKRNRRRAFSLTELLVVMGVSVVALVASTKLLRQVMTQQRSAGRDAQLEIVAQRLTWQFRQDVHAARTVELMSTPTEFTLRLSLPANVVDDRWANDNPLEVRYEVDAGDVTRVVREANGDVPVRREAFRFGDEHAVRVERLDAPDRLRLSVERFRLPRAVRAPDQPETATAQPFVNIEACVGRYDRLQNTTAKMIGANP